MVEITVFLEGITESEHEPTTLDRSTVFRQAFHKLLSQCLPEDSDISLIIESSGGWRAAAKAFLKRKVKLEQPCLLLIDLEGNKTIKSSRLAENFNGLESRLVDCKEEVFFMVQKMEAWILSQPDSIEEWAKTQNYIRKREQSIRYDVLLRPHPEEIENPDVRLDTILRQYFEEQIEKRGKIKTKAVGYKKGQTAPQLIMNLNFESLERVFDEASFLKKALISLNLGSKKN